MSSDLSHLPRQVRRRIEVWTEELTRHIYVPMASLSWRGFFTFDQLSSEGALNGPFTAAPEGMAWGAKGEYGWFATTFTVKEEDAGVTLASPIGLGGEMLVYCDGRACGSIDRHHPLVFLSFSAQVGEHTLLVESYAGHGQLLEGGGPIPPSRAVYPPVASHQQRISSSTVGRIEEEIYQLYCDVYTLTDLLRILEPTSLQAQAVAAGLHDFTKIVDFERDHLSLVESCVRARARLAPLLSMKNGSCAPRFSTFGQSHIDLAWKWGVSETRRKVGRTYANQLTLLERYPHYRFLLCEPALIEMLEEHHRPVFERVMARVQSGQIIAEGAFWVESDTNIPNAESLAKQLIYGQRWFRAQCGAYATFAWLPDTFGFSASLPQLLSQAGVESFSTQKLLRADPESERFPFTDFWWEGEDGTRILSTMCYRNNCAITPRELHQRWHRDRVQQEGIEGLLFPFGYGDGGGGPDRDLVESMGRLFDLQGLPRIVVEGPREYFERIREQVMNVHQGELYLAWHRGTYSSQQRLKELNARCEEVLREHAVWATLLDSFDHGREERWWKTLLFNQFHDILAGVSIKEVHQQAESENEAVIEEACASLDELLLGQRVADERWCTLFNSRLEEVRVWLPIKKRCSLSQDGEPVASYWDGSVTWVRPTLAPLSSTLLQYGEPQGEEAPSASLVKRCDEGLLVGDERLHFLLDHQGVVRDVTHEGRVVLSRANELLLFQDVNADYDAWELSKVSLDMERARLEVHAIEVLCPGPVVAKIRIHGTIDASAVVEILTYDSTTGRIEVCLEVDWQQRHTLLKSLSTHTLNLESYLCDTQLGYKRLPVHRSTRWAADRYEVCAQRYAAFAEEELSVQLSSSHPFGLSVHHKEFGLTLLRSSLIPDERAEAGLHRLHYAFDVVEGAFSGCAAKDRAELLNHRFPLIEGKVVLQAPITLLSGSALLTMLEREEGSAAMVVRLSNPSRTPVQVMLRVDGGYTKVQECNLLGEEHMRLECREGTVVVELPSFALKTLRFE